MKKNVIFILALLFVAGACKENEGEIDLTVKDRPVKVVFSLGGDISFSDEPFGGRIASNETTYFMIDIEDIDPTWDYEVSGLFDQIPNNLSIDLIEGRSYSVKLKAIRKGDTYGIFNSGNTLYMDGNRVITNELDYTTGLGFSINLNKSIKYYTSSDSSTTATSKNGSGGWGSSNEASPIDSYYGEVDITNLSASDSVISVNLIRNVFGFETVVSNLTTGVLDVSFAGRFTRYVPGGDSTTYGELSFYTQSTDSSYYTHNYGLSVIHRDTISDIPVYSTVYSGSVPFKRLHKKNILITAPADTIGGTTDGESGFNMILEDVSLFEGDTLEIN